MKKNWKTLVGCILIPLVVGTIAGLLTMGGMEEFKELNKPTLSPPAWLFPVAWTILYTLMGISSYLIYTNECLKGKKKILIQDGRKRNCSEGQKTKSLMLYGYQLLVNFLWPIFFFDFQWFGFAYFWLILLWILVAVMIWEFDKISKVAALLNIPYLLWLSFAGYLNLTVWILNQ